MRWWLRSRLRCSSCRRRQRPPVLRFTSIDGRAGGGGFDAVLVKFDSAGTQLWARQFGTETSQDVTGLAIDAAGSLYVIFVMKFSADGVKY